MLGTVAAALMMSTLQEPQKPDPRLDWWREAKFGLFIHWGLYSIKAGKHGDRDTHAEWIRTTAQIPLEEYNQLQPQFNPVKFNADEWARYAKDAGMKYVVITTKHHDGFALFDSQYTDWDIANTPFKRDIMAELSTAVRNQGLHMGWYHSIMDWHHPDYLPRRDWETNRSPEGADFNRFNAYLENQVTELLTKYGDIGVMWFDGEWESTWNHQRGQKLYDLCRKLQPNVIVNNRVDVGRGGMAGFSDSGYAGDFGTPEQEIPETGIPGVDWESCITMNRYWGWNAADTQWKSTDQLLQMLIDIVSKGGNLLLNVGPKPDGTFPEKAVTRLKEMGAWMKINGDAIYGTTASPFKKLPLAHATKKGKNLYIFLTNDLPENKIILPGLTNKITKAELLGSTSPIKVNQDAAETTLTVPKNNLQIPVIKLTLNSPALVIDAPEFLTPSTDFVATPHQVTLKNVPNYQLKYTTDGNEPTPNSTTYTSPIDLIKTTTLKAAYFQGNRKITATATQIFSKLTPQRPQDLPDNPTSLVNGISTFDYTGVWKQLPNFATLPQGKQTVLQSLSIQNLPQPENVARTFDALILAPETALYTFRLTSDDGSKFWINNQVVIDNDGLHSPTTLIGSVALQKGHHLFKLHWFNATGGAELKLEWSVNNGPFQIVPNNALKTIKL